MGLLFIIPPSNEVCKKTGKMHSLDLFDFDFAAEIAQMVLVWWLVSLGVDFRYLYHYTDSATHTHRFFPLRRLLLHRSDGWPIGYWIVVLCRGFFE